VGLNELINKVRFVVHMGKTGAECLCKSLERKKQKKKERNARFYSNNRDRIIENLMPAVQTQITLSMTFFSCQ